ncbi:MAG TPA: aspartate aminotransferase family protein [bacterium]|nr:aspartate aminotransferase family protein [bacterium]
MKIQDVQKLYEEFVLPTYAQTPLCLVKGKGSRVWDIQGREYLDFFPGWAVSGIGHCHPGVVSALKEQSRKILHISNNFLNLKQAQLAQAISKDSFPARVFFCNSGAEATDSAIKFARKYGSEAVSAGRFEIITMTHSFHGRTLAAITATAQEKVQRGFAPLPAGFRYAEFNDLKSVKSLITDKTIAIFLEPIQGEGGVNVATQEFIRGLREICDEKDLLLIFDEVQTGMGRTGKMFAYQHYGMEPDLMTLAKSLGGGTPIGALVVNRRIKKEVLTPGTHASTYGGNPLVCAAALGVFKAIKREKLLQNAVKMGEVLADRLEKLRAQFPSMIQKVKGVALMRALELSVSGAPIVDQCREKGLLINCTQEKILRIMPAINVSKTILKEGLGILEEVFRQYSHG